MQEENSLGSLLFANQNPANTQSGTTRPPTILDELCRHSQLARHETGKSGNAQKKQANAVSKKATAKTKIFPWMKESRTKPKQTGWWV
jgi:hypothetical protein